MNAPVFNQERGMTNLLVIDLSFVAYRKLMSALASTGNEVSGLGIVSVYQGSKPFKMRKLKGLPPQNVNVEPIVFRVEDVDVLDHGSQSYTEIKPQKVAEYINSVVKHGISPSQIRLWWHRHPLTKGWSSTDENTARNEPLGNPGGGPRIGWAISIVWCTGSGWNARYDQWGPDMTLEIPIVVDGQPLDHELQTQQKVAALRPKVVAMRRNSVVSYKPTLEEEWIQETLPWEEDDDDSELIAQIVAEVGMEMEFGLSVPDMFVAWDVANEVMRSKDPDIRRAIIKAAEYHHVPTSKAEKWADEVIKEVDQWITD